MSRTDENRAPARHDQALTRHRKPSELVMNWKQYATVAAIGFACAGGSISVTLPFGRPLTALHLVLACLVTALVTAKNVSASLSRPAAAQ
jgi:hypothetical protein